MDHAINALPNYHNRSAWERGAGSLLTRILCKSETVDQATLPLLRHGLETGSLQVLPADIEQGGYSALLALLARTIISTADLGASASTEASPPPLDADEQAIAEFLIQAGCSLTKQVHVLPGSADAMDMALALNADQILDRHLTQVHWRARTMMGLPWLHYAARRGMSASLAVLLKHGAPVDEVDAAGCSALFHASDAKCVEALLQHGANPSLFNAAGETPSAHWEARRGIKGDRLGQLRSALSKVPSTLSPEQEFEQMLKMLPKTPKSRLEKEIKRLRLTGAERQEGVGIVRGVLDRCRKQLRSSPKGGGAEGNQCTALMEFLGTWTGACDHATTAELCELHLVGTMWPSPGVAARALDRLTQKLPSPSERTRALHQHAKGLADGEYRADECIQRLVEWTFTQDDPMHYADVVLHAAVKMPKHYATHGAMAEKWEAAWAQTPEHPAWEQSSTVDGLAKLSTELAHETIAASREFQSATGRMAEHALTRGARVSPGVVLEVQNASHLNTRQKSWVESFVAQVHAGALDRSTPSQPAARRGPRL